MKKRLLNRLLSGASIALIALFSLQGCKERDDYPSFDKPEEEIPIEDVIPDDQQKTAWIQRIMDNSTYIKTFQMDTTQTIGAGLEYIHSRFINREDVPISMHILEIDQSKANVTMQALSPYNDYLYASQLLPDMISFNQNSALGNIVVAINGDASSSNIPTGSYVKSGRIIKSNSSRTRPYFGVRKGQDKIEFFNSPDTVLYPTTPLDLSGIKHLIGGTNFLLFQGDDVSNSSSLASRMGVGMNQDASKIYLVAVDGVLADYSAGISLDELRDVMKALGCYTAMQTNSGNSTSLTVLDVLKPEQAWIQKNRVPTFSGAPNAIGFVVK